MTEVQLNLVRVVVEILAIIVLVYDKIIPKRLPIVRAKVIGCRKRIMIKIAPATLTPAVTAMKLPLSRKKMKMASDIRSRPVIASPIDVDISDRLSKLLVLDLT